MPRRWRKPSGVNLEALQLYTYPDAFVLSMERGPWMARFRHNGWDSTEGTIDRGRSVTFRPYGYRVNSFGKIVEINPPETTNA